VRYLTLQRTGFDDGHNIDRSLRRIAWMSDGRGMGAWTRPKFLSMALHEQDTTTDSEQRIVHSEAMQLETKNSWIPRS
jgi:hypothetical protein